MTEEEFWQFLKQLWAKGRVSQVSGRIDSEDPEVKMAGEYMSSHSFLPQDYDKISEEKISQMGELLADKKVKLQTKEVILIILAHHISKEALGALIKYNNDPDKELKFFAEMALDECKMWNE